MERDLNKLAIGVKLAVEKQKKKYSKDLSLNFVALVCKERLNTFLDYAIAHEPVTACRREKCSLHVCI